MKKFYFIILLVILIGLTACDHRNPVLPNHTANVRVSTYNNLQDFIPTDTLYIPWSESNELLVVATVVDLNGNILDNVEVKFSNTPDSIGILDTMGHTAGTTEPLMGLYSTFLSSNASCVGANEGITWITAKVYSVPEHELIGVSEPKKVTLIKLR